MTQRASHGDGQVRAAAGETEHGQAGLSVLVVEDHEETADTMAALLRCWGHEARVAHDGLTALRAARERQPDVVLLDIGLPELDGYEVAKFLRPHPPHGRRPLLIAVTGYGQEEDRRRSDEAGIDLYLVKPVAPDQLFAVLKRFQRVISMPGD